jgi:myosin heavy subunit
MPKLDDDIDALFKLPLTEFVSARKALAARLKQKGLVSEAARVQALAKPSISAWTVNQLYWRHREEFEELIATGQRFHKARATGKMVNMREALDARSAALSRLANLATKTLRDAGHNPSLDILRRIGATLEALSTATSHSDRAALGRLTNDIDPPGFDAIGPFTPSPSATKHASKAQQLRSSKKTLTATSKTQPSRLSAAHQREARQARINAAKASLQQARKALTAARAAVKSLDAAKKKADAAAQEAAKHKREAEERFKKAIAAATAAALRAESINTELTKATRELDDAERAVASATKDLETSFRGSV